MMIYKTFFSTLFMLLFGFILGMGQTANHAAKQLKIACVGNSITYGSGVVNREKNAYPAQLQRLLGSSYTVQNFGVSGATLLKKGDKPYWNTNTYKDALEFAPDVVFIKLGTNDSKGINRVYLEDFSSDYKELIESFKLRNSKVRIVLLSPLPAFTTDSLSIWNPVIEKRILPNMQTVAYDTKVELIDLYQVFVDRSDLLPDGVHPSGLGASLIAQRLYETLVMTAVEQGIAWKDREVVEVGETSNFYGFPLTSFLFNGNECKIVAPKKTVAGMPWVLRARFWGHEPQTDIALLERGFHIAYCDVSDLFGNQEAVNRWNDFYTLMTQAGLAKKVVLEGMSRGGLIVYNWAEQNPEKVAGIYADAPVLDGQSWPGGLGTGAGSQKDWEVFKKRYDLKNDTNIRNFKGNPIHKTVSIAKGGFPMLHVCGETDEVVPIAENTVLFEKEIRKHGGDIAVIYKPDNGHHPHSLKNPKLIVNFILSATGQKLNFAIVPTPSAEYRSAAGWTEGSDWWTQASDIDSLCLVSKNVDLLFIGNSITQSFIGNRPHITSYGGKEAVDSYFSDLNLINAGISGDRTQHVLWRLQNGSYEKAQPKTAVLTLGVNNFTDDSSEEIIAAIQLVLKEARSKFPEAQIMLFGPLPTGLKADSDRRIKYRKVLEGLGRLVFDGKVSYHEISALFVDAAGTIKPDLYSSDGIHLKKEGYKVWGNYIKEHLK